MRDNIGLYRGKRKDSDEWVEGYYTLLSNGKGMQPVIVTGTENGNFIPVEVAPETVGEFSSLKDKNGTKIFEGDMVQYLSDDDFDCCSTVKFGEYKQDGSGGEYGATKCLGFYVEVDNFARPDWLDDDEQLPRFQLQQNILEVANKCKVIGNIHDNPELLQNTP